MDNAKKKKEKERTLKFYSKEKNKMLGVKLMPKA
jgi:hypothetical protein